MSTLAIQNLHVHAGKTEVVRDVSLVIQTGKVVALMGPNGSGKSSLVNAIMGHPKYRITSGTVVLDGEDITHMMPHEKAKKGIFLSMQNPPALPGVTVFSFLRSAVAALTGEHVPALEFQKRLEAHMQKMGIENGMAGRHVHEGFSGGEKKQLEALQLALLGPKFALLDETDAGLDVDSLRTIAKTIQSRSSEMGILLITHYTRILQYLTPDEVHMMRGGTIVQSGTKELAADIEKRGYGI